MEARRLLLATSLLALAACEDDFVRRTKRDGGLPGDAASLDGASEAASDDAGNEPGNPDNDEGVDADVDAAGSTACPVCRADQQCDPASGACRCPAGFTERSGACVDVDECAEASACHPSATCRNTEGAYACDCAPGFAGGGTAGFACAAAIAVADDHVCVVNADRRALCWGSNDHGQLGDGSAQQSSDTAVLVAGLDDVVMVDSAANYSCALTGDGKVRCWGANDRRQLGVEYLADRRTPVIVPGVDDAVLIATGSDACAVTRSGELICWGLGAAPARLAGVDGAVGLSISDAGTHLAHLRDGTIYGWNVADPTLENRIPTRLYAPAKAIGVSAGGLSSCIISPQRTALCAGSPSADGRPRCWRVDPTSERPSPGVQLW